MKTYHEKGRFTYLVTQAPLDINGGKNLFLPFLFIIFILSEWMLLDVMFIKYPNLSFPIPILRQRKVKAVNSGFLKYRWRYWIWSRRRITHDWTSMIYRLRGKVPVVQSTCIRTYGKGQLTSEKFCHQSEILPNSSGYLGLMDLVITKTINETAAQRQSILFIAIPTVRHQFFLKVLNFSTWL